MQRQQINELNHAQSTALIALAIPWPQASKSYGGVTGTCSLSKEFARLGYELAKQAAQPTMNVTFDSSYARGLGLEEKQDLK